MGFKIGSSWVGEKERTYLVAEVGQAHEGSFGFAKSYIKAAAEAQVDAIKFQMHIAEEESTYSEKFRIRFSEQDKTRFDYWKRMEFSEKQWDKLARYARSKKLGFICSPFSLRSVELLDNIGVDAWKISSGESISKDILCHIPKNVPILVSTGMSKTSEVDDLVKDLKNTKFGILQCTSKYPTKLDEIGLDMLEYFRARYGCAVGLSDHSGKLFPGLAAIFRGADILEVHITFDRRMFGPDSRSSLTIDEVRFLVEARDAAIEMNSIDKNKMAKELTPTRQLFSKSLALKTDGQKGDVITEKMLAMKKPGTGIQEKERVIGKVLKKNKSKREILTWEDFK